MEFNATFFLTIISFIAFVFLMNKLLYAPILEIVNRRTNFINENYSFAETDNKKAVELNLTRETKLAEAKEDGREKYNELISEFKEQKNNIIADAQEDVRIETDSSLADLENVSNETKEILKSKMTDLANDIVEKVLGYRSEVQGFDNDKVNDILYHQEG